MNVTIFLTVSKEDIEALSQVFETTEDENLKAFTSKVLREAQKEADSLIERGTAISSVNPFCMV